VIVALQHRARSRAGTAADAPRGTAPATVGPDATVEPDPPPAPRVVPTPETPRVSVGG
jgi:hypothetical protein